MENQNIQQSVIEVHAKTLNITTIHLTNALKSIHTMVYYSEIEIQRLNYAHNFFLTFAEIDYRINQLHNGL